MHYYRMSLKGGVARVLLADPVDFVPRIAEALRLNGTVIRKTISILQEAKVLHVASTSFFLI